MVFTMHAAGADQQRTAPGSGDLPALTVNWLPPCNEKNTEPYFWVDVFTDGRVRYVGGTQVREQGERQIQDAEAARTLIDVTRRARLGSKKSVYKKTDNNAPDYCLEIVGREGRRNRSFRAAAVQRRMQDVISAFGKLLDANHWVCPVRASVDPDARPTPMIRTGICEESKDLAIRLGKVDELTCTGHQIDIYRDVVHYYVVRPTNRQGNLGAPSTFVTEDFYPLSESDFQRILAIARRMTVLRTEVLEPGTGKASDEDDDEDESYLSRSQTDFDGVKQAVQSATKLEWYAQPSSQRCVTYDDTGSVLLYHDFGPPERP
jgi:hypothetical protein